MKTTFLLLLCFPLITFSQKLKKEADHYFNEEQWSAAVKKYEQYLKQDKKDSSAWYNLAISNMKLEQYDKSVEAFNQALNTKFSAPFVYYNLSKTYLLKRDKSKAYETLTIAADNGFSAWARLKGDEVFNTHQHDLEYQKILKKIETNAYPCLSAKSYRHFDFWLGEWDVYAGGNKVGDNSITMAKGGCAIHENYVTAGNYAGQSINYYDPIDKKWHQHWVGSGGDVYNYLETARKDGMLQFESKFMNAKGQISLSRLTFTLNEDGTVRQLFESSTDNGQSWTSAFDGLYKKKR